MNVDVNTNLNSFLFVGKQSMIFPYCDDRFVWDEAKYPTMSPLKEIVDSIHTQVAKIEDDLKVMIISWLEKILYRNKHSFAS